jgi:hypothetical protein
MGNISRRVTPRWKTVSGWRHILTTISTSRAGIFSRAGGCSTGGERGMMYYEQKIIGEWLFERNSPDGEWIPCDKDQIFTALADLVRRIKEYRVMAAYGDQVASSLDNFDKQLPEGK